MATAAARLAGGAALAGLALSPLLFALPHHSGTPQRLSNALVAFEPNAGRGARDVDFYARLAGARVAVSDRGTDVRLPNGRTVGTKLVGAIPSRASSERPLHLRVNDYTGSSSS